MKIKSSLILSLALVCLASVACSDSTDSNEQLSDSEKQLSDSEKQPSASDSVKQPSDSVKHRSAGQVVDDTSIAARTKAALLADPTTDGLNIDVEVDRDKVQLNGFVDSQAQVDRAGEIAKSVSGVSAVENNLKVSDGTRKTGEYIDDKVLSVSVKTALANDPLAPASEIDVEVNRGVVSLGGFVDSDAERDAAVATAKKVEGVKQVINNLTVR